MPDLVQKVLKGQDPLHILGSGEQIRHYTYGGDLAKGIVMCMESPKALNQDFNISTAESTSVLQLAELIWNKIHKSSKSFKFACDEAYEYDVQRRVPSTKKTKEVLGFECTTTLDEMLDEVIPWIRTAIREGKI